MSQTTLRYNILLLNLSQSLQNALSDNRAGNIGAYKNNDCQNNNAPAGLGKGIKVLANGYTGISQNRRTQGHKADILYIAVDNITAGNAGDSQNTA